MNILRTALMASLAPRTRSASRILLQLEVDPNAAGAPLFGGLTPRRRSSANQGNTFGDRALSLDPPVGLRL